MWRKFIDEKRKNDERGQEFNILDAILVAEFIEKSSQDEYTPLMGIHNLEITSQQTNINYEELIPSQCSTVTKSYFEEDSDRSL